MACIGLDAPPATVDITRQARPIRLHYMENTAPLLISHIPKTAGSSLKKLVEQWNPDTVFVYKRELALSSPNPDFIASFRSAPLPSVVMGHFSFGVHRMLGVPPRYASIFRDPIQRVVSLYRYQKSLPDSPFAEHFRAGMTLGEFVTRHITEMTNNHMCRVVAGVPPEAGVSIKERWLLETASENLEKYYCAIGVVEHYDVALQRLAKTLGWGEYAIPRENVTSGDQLQLDESTYSIVREFNAMDIELYNRVLALN